MRKPFPVVVGILALLVTARASDTIPAPPQTKPVAIKGATIHPVSGPDIPNGTIVFENGKITAIGADAAIPSGAEVVEANGKHVYPGLINANTVLGLVEIGAVRATVDVEEAGALNPNVRSITSVNPDSELIPVARAAGVLTALSVPEGGIISGQSAVLRLEGWTPEEMTVLSPAAMHLRWPNLTIDRRPRARKSVKDQQKEIDKAQKQIRDAFQVARAYWQSRKNPGPDFKTDLRWEALMPVFDGKLPLFVHASSLAQIQAALAWAKEMQLKIVLVDADDAWRVAAQLKESDVPVMLGPATSLPPRRDDDYDSGWSSAAKLQQAGVRFCIASNGRGAETNERNVGHEAGLAAGYGLPKEEALKAVTLYPAQILGIADRLGSLEPGKAATLIVTNGDPLDFPTQVEAAFVDGRKIDLSNRQTRLRDKYREKYRRK
ncbi:MAG TPA: amidohydrolase family protein [Chthoniobacterales bacterium]|nr:amidohydrolase family protein [Chthoniobacterales bacterium]